MQSLKETLSVNARCIDDKQNGFVLETLLLIAGIEIFIPTNPSEALRQELGYKSFYIAPIHIKRAVAHRAELAEI